MPLDLLVIVDQVENVEKQEKTVVLDAQADADLLDHVAPWVNLAKMALWDHQVKLETQDLMVNLENKAHKVFKVFPDFKV